VGATIPLARRHLLLASLLAVAASLGTSYLLHRSYGSTLRVVIADDQEMVRSGFRLILEANGIEVVGEATTGVEAVRLGRDLRPDVCLRDIRMPGLDGLEATRQLAGPGIEDPIPVVVVVTTFDLADYVRTAIDNGPSGFLPSSSKRCGPPPTATRSCRRRPPSASSPTSAACGRCPRSHR
jgi:CheY-like chemotaxis protein